MIEVVGVNSAYGALGDGWKATTGIIGIVGFQDTSGHLVAIISRAEKVRSGPR